MCGMMVGEVTAAAQIQPAMWAGIWRFLVAFTNFF
jgi:hypothetical protein